MEFHNGSPKRERKVCGTEAIMGMCKLILEEPHPSSGVKGQLLVAQFYTLVGSSIAHGMYTCTHEMTL